MVIGNRAFLFALLCGLTLLVGGAVADAPEMLTPVVRTSEVNSQAANTAPTFISANGRLLEDLGFTQAEPVGLAILLDGTILIPVRDSRWDNNPVVQAYRSDGTSKYSFGTNGRLTFDFGQYDAIASIASTRNNKFLIHGFGQSVNVLRRYNENGTLDASFGVNGEVSLPFGVSSGVTTTSRIIEQSDNKICVTYRTGYIDNDFIVIRLNQDGSYDNGFGVNGYVVIDYPDGYAVSNAMIIQDDGSIVIGGYTPTSGTNADFLLARLSRSGVLDTSFGLNGFAKTDVGSPSQSHDYLFDLTIQSNGRVLAIGESGGRLVVVGYSPDGNISTDFGVSGIYLSPYSSRAYSGLIDASGRIVLSGAVYDGGYWVPAAWRLTSSGQVDYDFGSYGISKPYTGRWSYYNGFEGSLYYGFMQSDGKVLHAGRAFQKLFFVRYAGNGNYDTEFGPVGNTLESALSSWERSPIILSGNVLISDIELAAIGTYDGATLTIAR